MVKASIVITSYNNAHNLEQCLRSLVNQNYNKSLVDLDIVIVDSGSTDDSIQILDKYKDKIKIILKPQHLPRLSPATARNTGAQNSKGDILIFSDSDCVCPVNWVQEIISIFNDFRIDCILGNREPDTGRGLGTFHRKYNFILDSRKFRTQNQLLINKESIFRKTPLILIAANNFAIRKQVWEKIGGMNENLKDPAGEDILMEIELIKSEFNILFAPHIKIIHNHPLSFKKLLNKAFYQGESIYFINRLVGGYINWKHFLQLKNFLKKLLISFFIFLFVILIRTQFSIKSINLVIIFFVLVAYNLLNLKKRLSLILHSKGKEYIKKYDLSLFQLLSFSLIDLLVKSVRLSGFAYSQMRNKLKILKSS